MKYSEAKQGRIFVIRLEDGDIVHDEIQTTATVSLKEHFRSAALKIYPYVTIFKTNRDSDHFSCRRI
ncbi:MAG: hypothetical protein V3W52_05150 [Syntrophobacteria bacterium]